MELRRDWAREYARFHDEQGNLISVPLAWTNLADEADPFVVLSQGRAHFRVADLLALAALIQETRP